MRRDGSQPPLGALVQLALQPTAVLVAVCLGSANAFAALKVVTTTQDLESLDARGRRRQGDRRVAREGLPGSALRRSQAQLHPEAALGRSADRRRARTGDRLAAAAHQPGRNARIQPNGDRYLDASPTAKILEIPTGQITRAMGDVHPSGNPHYWLGPDNGRRIAQADSEEARPRSAPATPRTSPSGMRTSTAGSRRRRSDGRRRWRHTRG